MKNKKKLVQLIQPYSSLADAICARVGHRSIAQWFKKLAECYPQLHTGDLPKEIKSEYIIHLFDVGMDLTFSHPHAIYADTGDANRWVFRQVDFFFSPSHKSAGTAPAPFNLNAETETPESAILKLSDDTTELNDDLRQSYYLDDGRVVCITWRKELAGIKEISVVKLGTDSDFVLPAAIKNKCTE